jgi:hypothetical protein
LSSSRSPREYQFATDTQKVSDTRHRILSEIVQHVDWLYFRFPLSFRDVEDLLAERGVDISDETARRWTLKFGLDHARKLRRLRPRSDGRMADRNGCGVSVTFLPNLHDCPSIT